MNAQQLVSGLRERGYWVTRTQAPSTTLIPRVEGSDPLLPWLRDELGCVVQQFQPAPLSEPGRTAFEVRLSSARVEVDETGLSTIQPDYSQQLAVRRARAIWEAAAPEEVSDGAHP